MRVPRVPSLSIPLRRPRIPLPSGRPGVAAVSPSWRVPGIGRIAGKFTAIPLPDVPRRAKLIGIGGIAAVAIALPVLLIDFNASGTGGNSDPATVEVAQQAPQPTAETVEGSTDATEPGSSDQQTEPTASATQTATPLPTPTPTPPLSLTISEDTTWTKESSPYTLGGTVHIKQGATLIIEPGVTVSKPRSGDMFWLYDGAIIAHGTPDEPIVFDGGDNSVFFNAREYDTQASIDLDYCEIQNGLSLWSWVGSGQFVFFNLRHSEITNLSQVSHVRYSADDIHIEYNFFSKSAGFDIAHRDDTTIYIQYNRFQDRHPALSGDDDYWIQNRGSFNESETLVRYNAFDPADGIAVRLLCHQDAASINAVQNYWGTQDEEIIRAMIFDRADDATCNGYIDYTPYLKEPHPDTPPA